MSDFLKTITANFETIDLAELAAKNVKNNFSQVKAITIKYKNVPRPEYNDNDLPSLPQGTALSVGAAMGNGMGGTTFAGAYPGFLPTNMGLGLDDHEEIDHSKPEIKRTTESCLIIKANETQSKQIEGHLRSMGGQHIITM